MTARAVDVHALPAMLTALRLPSFHRHWAGLAEVELAERETRRIQRHLAESRLPGGKTLATFDFKALPAVPRARIEALAAGDWIETGANLIAIHCLTGHCAAMSREGQLRRRQDPSALRHRPRPRRGRPARVLHPHHRSGVQSSRPPVATSLSRPRSPRSTAST